MIKTFRKYILLSTLALTISAGSAAQSPETNSELTLEYCIARALEANYSILISGNTLEIAANNVTYAPFLPSVTVSSRQSANRTELRNYNQDGEIEKSTSASGSVVNGANLNWRLFDGLAMFATREKQQELLSQGEFSFRSVAENLVMQISAQYYSIISLQNKVNLLYELVSISQERYNQALTRYNIGSGSGLEHKQAKIYLNSDSSSLLQQKENLKNAYIELYRLMNLPLDSRHQIKDTIIPEPQLDVAKLFASAEENNTTLLSLKAGEKIARLDTRLAKASRYPSLDFSAAYNYNFNQSQYFPSRYNESNGLNWGFSLSVPVFSGNEINRKIQNSRILEENARLIYEKERQSLQSELYQLYNIYSNNLTMIGFEEESRESALLNLEAAREKYRLGSLSGIEFRDIQLSYLNASDRRLNAIYQAKISEITLHLMAGELFRK
ncbi:MAG: TolC family protein [Bacteroidetes bacterium HGW-Bacteroidetes-10]|nr:MAG: TolC family protein [Bacteroidetes bacterium HGW-Bacteroidetes-10]